MRLTDLGSRQEDEGKWTDLEPILKLDPSEATDEREGKSGLSYQQCNVLLLLYFLEMGFTSEGFSFSSFH